MLASAVEKLATWWLWTKFYIPIAMLVICVVLGISLSVAEGRRKRQRR